MRHFFTPRKHSGLSQVDIVDPSRPRRGTAVARSERQPRGTEPGSEEECLRVGVDNHSATTTLTDVQSICPIYLSRQRFDVHRSDSMKSIRNDIFSIILSTLIDFVTTSGGLQTFAESLVTSMQEDYVLKICVVNVSR